MCMRNAAAPESFERGELASLRVLLAEFRRSLSFAAQRGLHYSV